MHSWQHSCYVLHQVWSQPITTKSDKAREWADTLAWATARGYLTTEVAPGSREYGRYYKVTPKGLQFVWDVLDGLTRESVLEIVSGKYRQEEAFWEQGEVCVDRR